MTGAQQTDRPVADECPVRSLRLCLTQRKGAGVPKQTPLVRDHRSGVADEPDDDTALLVRTAAGDRAAYSHLVKRHLGRVLAVCRRMLGNDAHAEEAAQDALLKLWTHAASYDPGKAKLTTWLTKVAVNVCLDRLRKRGEDSWPEDFDVALPASQDRQLMQEQVAARVDAALQKLPERQRLALVLCHYEEMTMVEAANVLDATPEAIESLLSRARRGLKKMLEPEWRMLLAEDDAV